MDKIESLSYSPYEGYEKAFVKEQISYDVNLLQNIHQRLEHMLQKIDEILEGSKKDNTMPIDLGLWISGNYRRKIS